MRQLIAFSFVVALAAGCAGTAAPYGIDADREAAIGLYNGARFVDQAVPRCLAPGQSSAVRVVFENSGTSTWSATSNFRLGVGVPGEPAMWTGDTRVNMQPGVAIPPGERLPFEFTITAPATPGEYPFRWRMVQEGQQWFGGFSPSVLLRVGDCR